MHITFNNRSPPVKKEKLDTKDLMKKEKMSPKKTATKPKKSLSPKTASPKVKKTTPGSATKSKSVSPVSIKKEASQNDSMDESKEIVNEENKKSPTKSEENKPINPFFNLGKKSVASTDEGANYSPDKSKYHPIDDAFWKYGEK